MSVIQLHARRADRVPPFISFSRAANHIADPRADDADLARAEAEWECPIALDVPTLPEVDQGFMVNASGIDWAIALAVCSAAMGCGGFIAWGFLQALNWWFA